MGLGVSVIGTAVGERLAWPCGLVGPSTGVGSGGTVGDGVGGTAVGSRLGVQVAVMANTTAPASASTGGGGAAAHRHTAHPRPAIISSPPRRSMALDRSGAILFNRRSALRNETRFLQRNRVLI